MDFGSMAIRCVVAFAFLLLMTRLRGKHVVSESTSFDFVLALTLGNMTDDFILADVPATQFVVGAGTLVVADLMVTYGSWFSDTFHKWAEGLPRIIMVNGESQKRSLRAEQMNQADFDHLFRLQGLEPDRFDEVRMGVLEIDSQLSVLRHGWAKAVRRKDRSSLPHG